MDNSEKYPGKLGKILMRPKKKVLSEDSSLQFGLRIRKNTPHKFRKKLGKILQKTLDNLSVVHKRAILWEIFNNNKKLGKAVSLTASIFENFGPIFVLHKTAKYPQIWQLVEKFSHLPDRFRKGGRSNQTVSLTTPPPLHPFRSALPKICLTLPLMLEYFSYLGHQGQVAITGEASWQL